MKKTRAIVASLALFACAATRISAQEALLSTAENYYELESLFGNAERPYLNYRTLSDSRWTLVDPSAAIWGDVNLGSTRELPKGMSFRAYGPEFFSSYNSAAPYGQNDGALWQGKGLNSSLSAGARVEGYGFALTFKPQIAFSQNKAFDLVAPAYSGSSFAGKGDTYGYYGIANIDAPQRFGEDPFWTFSWGDSEIRYSWKTLTVGFGTQSIWLGPAKINPILHSNNAPPYPKIDIGMRKQAIVAFGRDLGDAEARFWWGKTTESEYFDNDDTNDHNLITGMTVSIAPGFSRDLTFGFHRTMLSKWEDADYASVFTLMIPAMRSKFGDDTRDQRASLTISYRFPAVGFETYMEWARNDFSGDNDLVLRYPFHSQGYTVGAEKGFTIRNLRGKVVFEHTNLESSRDYELLWPTTFYCHGVIPQGYTERGQWIGAGMGTGGNSQSLAVNLYGRKGSVSLSLQRQNPDNDYVWFQDMGEEIFVDSDGDGSTKRYNEFKFKTVYTFGVSGVFLATRSLSANAGVSFSAIHNPLYQSVAETDPRSEMMYNTRATLGFSLSL